MPFPAPSMLMLPAADLARSATFYLDAFGWDATAIGPDALMLSSGGALAVVLVAAPYFAQESGLSETGGGKAMIPVVALESRDAVDSAASSILGAGGAITTPARDRDFGIYSFYASDPDGNTWEILVNPPA